MQSIANKVISRIYGHGRGWAFTQKDLADCGSLMAVDKALARLRKAGTIRQVLRGVYDYPQLSRLLNGPVIPDADRIAHALARKFGWSMYPSGELALNLLGLSTQVPSKYIYFSDGPSRTYGWRGGKLFFKRRSQKETASLSFRTAMVVQALKALGQEQVDSHVVNHLRKKLTGEEKALALREARYVTGWIYEIIRQLAREETADE